MSSCEIFRRSKGKWRGLEFEWQSEGIDGGKRIALHQYPFKKEFNTKDLGCNPHRYSVEGVICGDELRDRVREFVSALDEEGPGELYDPYLNEDIQVQVESWTISPVKTNLTSVRFFATFVQAGAAIAPLVGDSTLALMATAVDDLERDTFAAFQNSFEITGRAGAVVNEAIQDTNATWSYIAESYRFSYTGGAQVDFTPPGFETILTSGQANDLEVLFDSIEEQFTDDRVLAFFQTVAAIDIQAPDLSIPGGQIAYRNALALEAATARLAFARYASFLINREYCSQQEALVAISKLRSLANRILERADALGDLEVRQDVACLVSLGAGIANNLPSLAIWERSNTSSALALAHEIYCDSGRAEELIKLNCAINGSFIPPRAVYAPDD